MNKKKILLIVLVSLILVFEFTLQLYLSRADSQTTDEGVHLSAGYTYLTKHDFRMNPEHPPLVKSLSAFPLLFAKFNTPSDASYFDKAGEFFYDSWLEARHYGDDLLYGLANDADRIMLLARLPMIFLTLMLGFAIFYISSKIWGESGGVLSLVLFVLEPIVLAHGHLVTTDIAVSLGYLLSIYFLWKFLNSPSWKNTIVFGVVLGIAQLFKFTAIILLPTTVILLVYFAIAHKDSVKSFFAKFGKIIIAFMITWFVIWAGYCFKTATIPSSANGYQLSYISAIAKWPSFKYLKFLAIPRDYVKGAAIVLGHTQVGHDSFLLGQTSKTGWWYYFPVVFSAKTTIPLLILLLLSIIFIAKSDKKTKPIAVFMLIAAAIYLIFAMKSKANLGVRHIMPIYAIIFVLCGVCAKNFKDSLIGKAIMIVLVGALLFENYKAFPSYISYYNQFYGGSESGYKVATDSNYDWGQDLKRIRTYVNSNQLTDYVIEYAWDSDKALAYYGLSTKKYSSEDQSSKYLIVNASSLHTPPFEALQTKPIYARITPSVFVYELNKPNVEQN